jgi:hypothetical protein
MVAILDSLRVEAFVDCSNSSWKCMGEPVAGVSVSLLYWRMLAMAAILSTSAVGGLIWELALITLDVLALKRFSLS